MASRQEFQFSLTSNDKGKMRVKLFDRITVDDVFLHLVNREIFRVMNGLDAGTEINQVFKDFLLKERFTAGQN